jgi:hypothetical protein
MEHILSQTHSQYGNLARKVKDSFTADSSVGVRMAGAGTDYKLGGIIFYQFVQRYFIVSKDGDGRSLEHQILVYIPREGVIIVNENQI